MAKVEGSNPFIRFRQNPWLRECARFRVGERAAGGDPMRCLTIGTATQTVF
jgi:hypothetical protein